MAMLCEHLSEEELEQRCKGIEAAAAALVGDLAFGAWSPSVASGGSGGIRRPIDLEPGL